MRKDLEVQAVMTTFPHSIGIDQTLETAKEMMREHGVRHLPVQDGGQLVGVLSHRDINFVLAVDKKPASELVVEDSFTAEPYVVELADKVSIVARHMAAERLGCALVTENGKLVGIFTAVDACRTLADVLTD